LLSVALIAEIRTTRSKSDRRSGSVGLGLDGSGTRSTILCMVLHIRKLCVGAESLESLQHWQAGRLKVNDGRLWHRTRTWPRRSQEILREGGSLYWIIKGQMACRQPIVGFEPEAHEDPDERPYCRIMLGPELIPTDPWPHRPFQGWRYLKEDEAPPDLASGQDSGELPPALAAELRAIGAW